VSSFLVLNNKSYCYLQYSTRESCCGLVVMFFNILAAMAGKLVSAGSPEAGVRSWPAMPPACCGQKRGRPCSLFPAQGLAPLSWFSSPMQMTIPSLSRLISWHFGRSDGCRGSTRGAVGMRTGAGGAWGAAACSRVAQLRPETSHHLQTTEKQQMAYGNRHCSVTFLLEINEF